MEECKTHLRNNSILPQIAKYKNVSEALIALNERYVISKDKEVAREIIEIVDTVFRGDSPIYNKTKIGIALVSVFIGLLICSALFLSGAYTSLNFNSTNIIGSVLLITGMIYFFLKGLHKSMACIDSDLTRQYENIKYEEHQSEIKRRIQNDIAECASQIIG